MSHRGGNIKHEQWFLLNHFSKNVNIAYSVYKKKCDFVFQTSKRTL